VILITWNVQWFCGLDDVVSVERVLHDARTMADFDVLCLQEVAIDYPRLAGDAGFDQVTRVRELLPGYEVRFGAAVDELGRACRWPTCSTTPCLIRPTAACGRCRACAPAPH
jgi:endonuclease/exonuclease/phosphatase family metal-dependent hydrolase